MTGADLCFSARLPCKAGLSPDSNAGGRSFGLSLHGMPQQVCLFSGFLDAVRLEPVDFGDDPGDVCGCEQLSNSSDAAFDDCGRELPGCGSG
mmetsp:Transcript_93854/g.148268  ORF Transcript_93854/g.148268 Transcript_93854/m.148268 type:complete len:92 (-) Transcript_93854:879-1154(-)